MSTPLVEMFEIADNKLEAYKSDLLHDGIVIGKNENCNEFVWIVRPMGTAIVPLKPDLQYVKDQSLESGLHPILEYYRSDGSHSPEDQEIDVYHLKNPLNDTNNSDHPGMIKQISFEQAIELYMDVQKKAQESQKMYENTINHIEVFSKGDTSVGIPDYHLVLHDKSGAPIMDYGCLAEDEQHEVIENFRTEIQNAFEIAIGESPVNVYFDCDALTDDDEPSFNF